MSLFLMSVCPGTFQFGLVDVVQTGYIAGAVIGQKWFPLKTYTEQVSTEHVVPDRASHHSLLEYKCT